MHAYAALTDGLAHTMPLVQASGSVSSIWNNAELDTRPRGCNMHAYIANWWVELCSKVSKTASFSMSKAVFSAKSPLYFSCACGTEAVDIAHEASRSL